MQIAILGCGMWGSALATLLAKKNHSVRLWGRNPERVQQLRFHHRHPKLERSLPKNIAFTSEIKEALSEVDLVIESVTMGGLRETIGALRRHRLRAPLILTSKGIEVNSHLLPSQIAQEILGANASVPVLALSGPSLAQEVMDEKPTCVVLACKELDRALKTAKLLTAETFSVFPHSDLLGVQFGGAYKNIIAIACGMIDSLGLGANTKAALLTRGLHEMRRLALAIGCLPQTLTGLSGLGDLVATCLSTKSRNYLMGHHLTANTPEEAKERVGSCVEGIETCRAILSLGATKAIALPIAHAVRDCLDGHPPEKLVCEFMHQANRPEWS